MAPKRHGRGNRKRKIRNTKKPVSAVKRNKIDSITNEVSDIKSQKFNTVNAVQSESDVSSDEEINPYQELVSSLTSNKVVIGNSSDSEDKDENSDEDKSSEDEVDENNEDNYDENDEEEDRINEDQTVDNMEENDDSDGLDDNQEHSGSESESDDHDQEDVLENTDPFLQHFEKEISEKDVTKLSKAEWKKSDIKIPHLGHSTLRTLTNNPQKLDPSVNLKNMHVKQSLCEEVKTTNLQYCSDKEDLSPLQNVVFKVLNRYQDLYFPCREQETGEQIRLVYCLHALNHVLKTRKQVISHNSKLKTPGNEDNDYRDQGLTRPKVLIVLPFREAALRVVNIMISLLKSDDQSMVSNKKRFTTEYKEDTSDQKKGMKPEDYEATFTGSTDDHFRIGLSVAKKTLKLYTKFYSSDIILASPLGLRTVIGSDGDKERDYDFLNSIEMLILDQTDILLMQNWDHIIHLMKHLHLQPSESHGTDFSRVRMWTLNGWSKYYRQTILVSSVSSPQMLSLFNKHCYNFSGKVTVHRPETQGTISQVVVQLPQVYHKLNCTCYSQLADDRFNFFIKKILPTHKDPVLSQTFIYVPSYFDFVRLRNYFVREDLSFVYISEYTKDKTISKSRNQFFHGNAHFMLYTERAHFYRRFKIRGIRHIVFYELPLYGHFYSELCNMLLKSKQDNASCTVLYSQYDVQKLTEIVGSERASHMLTASKNIHMFVTGE